jgi:hypothetical protein
MSLVIDEHRDYLADTVRVSAFDSAICEVVRPGDIVVDLGSGTGVLGLLACRAGARHVFSIDSGPIVGLAREIAHANGFDDRMTFLRELSTRAELPERADVLVTDQIGHVGFEAGLVEYIADAKQRLLKPNPRILPAGVNLFAAPIEAADRWDAIEFWRRTVSGLSFTPMWRPAASTGYPLNIAATQLLGEPGALGPLELGDADTRFSGSGETTVSRRGTLHGIGCWFEARLSPGVTMTNSPVAARRIDRRQAFFAIERPISVDPGDTVTIAMVILPVARIVSWTVSVRRIDLTQPLETFTGSTFNGMLISAEDMSRTDPRSVPVLTAAGRGRRTTLELCDGRRDLASIEREIIARHPELFPNPSDASTFVAELVSRYTRPS